MLCGQGVLRNSRQRKGLAAANQPKISRLGNGLVRAKIQIVDHFRAINAEQDPHIIAVRNGTHLNLMLLAQGPGAVLDPAALFNDIGAFPAFGQTAVDLVAEIVIEAVEGDAVCGELEHVSIDHIRRHIALVGFRPQHDRGPGTAAGGVVDGELKAQKAVAVPGVKIGGISAPFCRQTLARLQVPRASAVILLGPPVGVFLRENVSQVADRVFQRLADADREALYDLFAADHDRYRQCGLSGALGNQPVVLNLGDLLVFHPISDLLRRNHAAVCRRHHRSQRLAAGGHAHVDLAVHVLEGHLRQRIAYHHGPLQGRQHVAGQHINADLRRSGALCGNDALVGHHGDGLIRGIIGQDRIPGYGPVLSVRKGDPDVKGFALVQHDLLLGEVGPDPLDLAAAQGRISALQARRRNDAPDLRRRILRVIDRVLPHGHAVLPENDLIAVNIPARRRIVAGVLDVLRAFIDGSPVGRPAAAPLRGFGDIHHIVEELPVRGALVGIKHTRAVHLVLRIVVVDQIIPVAVGISQGIDGAAIIDPVAHVVMDEVIGNIGIFQDVGPPGVPAVANVIAGIGNMEDLVVLAYHIGGIRDGDRRCGAIVRADIVDIVVADPEVLQHFAAAGVGIFLGQAHIDGAAGNIIEVVADNGAVLHGLPHLQGVDADPGEGAVLKMDAVCALDQHRCRLKHVANLPDVVVLDVGMAALPIGPEPGGVGKGNAFKADVLYHPVLRIAAAGDGQQLAVDGGNAELGVGQVLKGPGHIIEFIFRGVKVPLAGLVQQLQGIFDPDGAAFLGGGDTLIQNISPAGLIQGKLDLSVVFRHGGHMDPGLGPLHLEYQLQLRRSCEGEQLRIAADIAHVGAVMQEELGIGQAALASGAGGTDIVDKELAAVRSRGHIRHIDRPAAAAGILRKRRAGKVIGTSDDRIGALCGLPHHGEFSVAAAGLIQLQGAVQLIVTVCEDHFDVAGHSALLCGGDQLLHPGHGGGVGGAGTAAGAVGRQINGGHYIGIRDRYRHLRLDGGVLGGTDGDRSRTGGNCRDLAPFVNGCDLFV